MDMRSLLGYSQGSPWENSPYNLIKTKNGRITMSNTKKKLKAFDAKTGKFLSDLEPGKEYHFPNVKDILELPAFQGGGNTPIIVTNSNDPRLKAYRDSVKIYNANIPLVKQNYENLNTSGTRTIPFNQSNTATGRNLYSADGKDLGYKVNPNDLGKQTYPDIYKNIKPEKMVQVDSGDDKSGVVSYNDWLSLYKKPVQPVVYQKPESRYTLNNAPRELLDAIAEFDSGKNKRPVEDLTSIFDKYKVPKTKDSDGVLTYKFDNLRKKIPQERKDYPIRGPLPKAKAKINITTPQQSVMPEQEGIPVYGPANSTIGYYNNGKFSEYQGVNQRSIINNLDTELLKNPEELKKYLKTKGLPTFQAGGQYGKGKGQYLLDGSWQPGYMENGVWVDTGSPIPPQAPQTDQTAIPNMRPPSTNPNPFGESPWIAKGQSNPLAPNTVSTVQPPLAPVQTPVNGGGFHGEGVEGSKEFEDGLPDDHPYKKQTSESSGRTTVNPFKKTKKFKFNLPGAEVLPAISAGLTMFSTKVEEGRQRAWQQKQMAQINQTYSNAQNDYGVDPYEQTGQLRRDFKKGGIHIDPENRGKFNATKASTGKTTEELTHSKNPLTRKRAIFAQNAAKWHHQKGGKFDIYKYLYGDDDNNEQVAKVEEASPQKKKAPRVTEEDINELEQYGLDPMSLLTGENSYQNYSRNRGKNTGSGQFRSFNTYEEGKEALYNQLNLYKTGKTKTGLKPTSTLYEAMATYAPASDNNNPKAYAEFIGKKLGVDPNTKISSLDTKQWADAIEKMEGNKKGNNPGNLRPHQKGGLMKIPKKFLKGGTFNLDEAEIQNLIKQGYKIERL